MPSTISLYQKSPHCAIVTDQAEQAFAEYLKSTTQPEAILEQPAPKKLVWRQFKDALHRRYVIIDHFS